MASPAVTPKPWSNTRLCCGLKPNRSIVLSSFGELLWAMRQRNRAAQLWLRRNQLDGFSEDYLTRGEKTLKTEGPESFLRFVITEFEQKRGHGEFVSPYGLARLYGLAGENRARWTTWNWPSLNTVNSC